MISSLIQATANDWKHWACSQRDKGPDRGDRNGDRTDRSCMGMPALIQPRLSKHALKQSVAFIDDEGGSDGHCAEFAGSPPAWNGQQVFPARSFSLESAHFFLAARDSSIECCQESLLSFEASAVSPRKGEVLEVIEKEDLRTARYDLEIKKCCHDLRVALAKQKQGASSEDIGAIKHFERRGYSQGSLDTSVGDDESQQGNISEEESDDDEAIDRMYAQADVSTKIGIARDVSPNKSRVGVDQRAAQEVQAYQDIMRKKFDRIGQHGGRPLCHTANPTAAVFDAVSRYYEVNEEVGEYYAMPGDGPCGSGLTKIQQQRLSRYARCLADAQVKATEKPQQPLTAAAPAVQENPKKFMFRFF